MELNTVQEKIKECLEGKKFLIVLDDVWNASNTDWNTLRAPLVFGSRGSKIIATTRLVDVADTMRTTESTLLKPMTNEDCWRLFCIHAGRDPNGRTEFERIGRQIANKCSGLPLPAMVLGGLLRRKECEEDWEAILHDRSWGSKELEERELLSVLKMSYDDLPSHLKRCFAFCAMFPEDHQFKENDLVLLWLGAGIIPWDGSRHKEDDHQQAEMVVGHVFFRDLVSRSMFLPSSSYRNRFVMHDLVRCVALEVSGNACYAMEEAGRWLSHPVSRGPTEWVSTRHLSFGSHSLHGIFVEIMGLTAPPPLRTFLPLEGYLNCDRLPQNGLCSLFTKLRYLRVLSLRRSSVTELPESIGKLRHLKYLDLSDSSIARSHMKRLPRSITSLLKLEILILARCSMLEELPDKLGNFPRMRYLNLTAIRIRSLPESITSLTSLEILILSECKSLHSLPEDIGSLRSLRHLNLSSTLIRRLPDSTTSLQAMECLILRDCKNLFELPPAMENLVSLRHLDVGSTDMVRSGRPFPPGISQMSNLRTLSDYVVGMDNARLLGNLNNLKGALRIWRLENESSPDRARSAKLREKRLEELTLQWTPSYGSSLPVRRDARREEDVLEELRPHRTLKSLAIKGYCGRRLPSWLTAISLTKLVFEECSLLEEFPEETPSLQVSITECCRLEEILQRQPGRRVTVVPRVYLNDRLT